MNSSDNSVDIMQNLAHAERKKELKNRDLKLQRHKGWSDRGNMCNQISKSRGKFIFEKVVTE